MLSGDSQYGHTFDQWGHHFGTRNWSHIYHEVLAAPYIQRNDHLELPSSMQYVPDYGIGFEIYPITQNPEHQLLTDVGAITSSCGITWYMGGLFPEPYQQVVFIAEPTHNLVHTDVMYEKGATFGSRKQFENQEFLASTDGWFRPVNFYTGPDGSMYMLDFHRKIIEHPEWMSEEVLNSGELYQGLDKGRIFRITPTATPANFKDIKLGQVPTKELIPYLQHPNIWWRRHAQRLLVDSQDQELITTLKEFFSDTNDLGALHTLWTLEGIKHFDEHLISMALEHSSPAVRENGLKIAEIHREKFPALESKLVSMVDDPHPKVRFQLLCTLGYFDSKASAETRRKLMFDNLEDPWMQLAGLSALSVDVLQLLTDAVNEFGINRVEGTETLFRNLGKTIAKNGNNYQTDQAVDLIAKNSGPGNDWWRSLVMRGISESLNQPHELSLSDRGQTTLKKFFTDKETPELRSASLELLNSFGYLNRQSDLVLKATNTAVNRDMSAQFRADALKVLAWADANGNSILFQQILATEKNPKLRSSAIESLKRTNGNQACDFLVDQWKNLTPAERDLAVGVFNTSSERQLRLLKAIESNRIQASVLGWGRTVRLLNNSNEQVRTMAREVLEGNETISDSVWQQYQEVLAMNGDPIRGEMVFASACSSCHQLSGQHGVKYGPDLSAVRNRSKSGIMIDILKPNRSISDGYDLWTIEDTFGKVHSGIVSDENANTLTLRNAAGEEVFIQQSDIVDRAASEISGMPEGLHNQISHQEMADLLEYLKKGVSGS
jgi:putative heme-binding domain-containing protein